MRFLTVVAALLLSLVSLVSAGQDSPDTAGYRHYREAVSLARRGQHQEARRLLLGLSPRTVQADILLGKLYGWDRAFDSARLFLADALLRQPDNEEAGLSITRIEYWSGRFAEALARCDSALGYHPHSEKLLIQKAKIYAKQGKYKDALPVIREVLAIDPYNGEAIGLEKYLRSKMAGGRVENGVGVSWQHDGFNEVYSPWNMGSVYYFHKDRGGMVSAGVNYASRLGSSGYQYAANWHPRLSSSTMVVLGAAYSKDSVFPGWNLGAGLSRTFFRRIALDAGVRWLKFYGYSDAVLMYTGAFSLSLRRVSVSVRTYLTPQRAGLDQAWYLATRYYLGDPNSHITLTVGTGSFPHDYFDPVAGKELAYATRTSRVRLGYQTSCFSYKNIFKLSVGYERRDYYSGVALERTTMGIGVERLF